MLERGRRLPVIACLGVLLAGCEDPSTAPEPASSTDSASSASVEVEPRSSLGAAKRSAENLEKRIGDYQQKVIEEADKAW